MTNINLNSNLIEIIKENDLANLQNLLVLNLSYNNLGDEVPREEMQGYREMLVTRLPPSLIMLQLDGNPCAVSHQKEATMELVNYRKPFALGLPHIESLDKVEVNQAEKLAHKGFMPKVARDFPGYIEDLVRKAGIREANEKLDKQIATEVKRAQGIDSNTSLEQSLTELGKMEEFEELNSQMEGMMSKIEMKKEEYAGVKNARQKKIEMMSKMVTEQYGKPVVPRSSQRKNRFEKVEMIEHESLSIQRLEKEMEKESM